MISSQPSLPAGHAGPNEVILVPELLLEVLNLSSACLFLLLTLRIEHVNVVKQFDDQIRLVTEQLLVRRPRYIVSECRYLGPVQDVYFLVLKLDMASELLIFNLAALEFQLLSLQLLFQLLGLKTALFELFLVIVYRLMQLVQDVIRRRKLQGRVYLFSVVVQPRSGGVESFYF